MEKTGSPGLLARSRPGSCQQVKGLPGPDSAALRATKKEERKPLLIKCNCCAAKAHCRRCTPRIWLLPHSRNLLLPYTNPKNLRNRCSLYQFLSLFCLFNRQPDTIPAKHTAQGSKHETEKSNPQQWTRATEKPHTCHRHTSRSSQT